MVSVYGEARDSWSEHLTVLRSEIAERWTTGWELDALLLQDCVSFYNKIDQNEAFFTTDIKNGKCVSGGYHHYSVSNDNRCDYNDQLVCLVTLQLDTCLLSFHIVSIVPKIT